MGNIAAIETKKLGAMINSYQFLRHFVRRNASEENVTLG
jgi:hypothetical protein